MMNYRYVAGQKVAYRPPHAPKDAIGEPGAVIRDVGGDFVHVRYGNDYIAKATYRRDLSPRTWVTDAERQETSGDVT